MCLVIISEELTAKADISVYKIIDHNNRSLYQIFKYKPNKLYRLRKKLKKIKKKKIGFTEYCINDGYHAYISLDAAIRYHAPSNPEWFPTKVVAFTIPKGAKYYKGNNYDIVSSSIRSGDLQEIK